MNKVFLFFWEEPTAIGCITAAFEIAHPYFTKYLTDISFHISLNYKYLCESSVPALAADFLIKQIDTRSLEWDFQGLKEEYRPQQEGAIAWHE